jgi:hypothetical protein
MSHGLICVEWDVPLTELFAEWDVPLIDICVEWDVPLTELFAEWDVPSEVGCPISSGMSH